MCNSLRNPWALGLRVLCLLEYQVRRHLAEHAERLAGLYAGNPKRTTRRPGSEALLKAFKGLHMTALTQFDTVGEPVGLGN